jgi:tetratricopeptide (TPR) repeat protein
MTRAPGLFATAVLAEAKALIAEGDVPAALDRYRAAFEELVAKNEHYDASNVAHMAGTLDEDLATKLIWNVLALHEADAETDRASVAWFYPSLHNNLAYAYAHLGDKDETLAQLRKAWARVGALEPGPYADRVRETIRRRLDELTR